jgi:hypothetical protein
MPMKPAMCTALPEIRYECCDVCFELSFFMIAFSTVSFCFWNTLLMPCIFLQPMWWQDHCFTNLHPSIWCEWHRFYKYYRREPLLFMQWQTAGTRQINHLSARNHNLWKFGCNVDICNASRRWPRRSIRYLQFSSWNV